jgi:hypothetical protein
MRLKWDQAFAATLLDRMDAREERLARNETLFRSVNENIEDAAASGQTDEQSTFSVNAPTSTAPSFCR